MWYSLTVIRLIASALTPGINTGRWTPAICHIIKHGDKYKKEKTWGCSLKENIYPLEKNMNIKSNHINNDDFLDWSDHVIYNNYIQIESWRHVTNSMSISINSITSKLYYFSWLYNIIWSIYKNNEPHIPRTLSQVHTDTTLTIYLSESKENRILTCGNW